MQGSQLAGIWVVRSVHMCSDIQERTRHPRSPRGARARSIYSNIDKYRCTRVSTINVSSIILEMELGLSVAQIGVAFGVSRHRSPRWCAWRSRAGALAYLYEYVYVVRGAGEAHCTLE